MQVKDIRYVLHSKPSEPQTYNLPTVSKVGVAMVEDGNLTRPSDLYVVAKDHSLLRLFETDEKYDPLQYPLLFPYGDLGWTYTDAYANGAKYRNKRKMSLREHVAYRLFQKVDDRTARHQGGRLFQQWVVDQRAKCEQEQLRWVAKNQRKLRAELNHGISDALLNEETITLDEGEVLVSEYDRATGTLVHPDRGSGYEPFLNQVGKRIVLPDSHSGSPRNMYKHYQESMAIVREDGKPDAFITMTCNPKGVEIVVPLPDEQTAQDRPDIVARVWRLKLKAKLAALDKGLLGRLYDNETVNQWVQGKTHAVTTLTVYLDGGQMVVFQPNDDPDRVLGHAGSTMLTSFFELCGSPEPVNEIAKTMLYQEIPKEFSWDAKANVWVRRKKYRAAIGRLIYVSPMDRERFYLRLLLCHRKGPTSFEHLRTVDGVVHPTFQAAAMHSGFLENDQAWIACMSEASSFRMPYQLRQLFAPLLVYSQVSDVRGLCDQFDDELARDFAYQYRNLEGQTKQDIITFHTLKSLNDLLQISGQAVAGFDLPQLSDYPPLVLDSLLENKLNRRELEGYAHSVLQDVDDHTESPTKVNGRYTTWFWVQYTIRSVGKICSSSMDRMTRENPPS
ncbi:unnamed protein product [Phytophthora fragariaefolia]|uniref:Unnamed protein product n=1 Tax=Phytophthora fragariaefolia TaxID=1490495 RepID=A0A9W7CVI4_9STRA|nr:unnamed protein product [Phytophthora fragariaefolia]